MESAPFNFGGALYLLRGSGGGFFSGAGFFPVALFPLAWYNALITDGFRPD
ncbi:hypothetical protein AALC17_08685 [Oscillospiraceae bacterium 38-13]